MLSWLLLTLLAGPYTAVHSARTVDKTLGAQPAFLSSYKPLAGSKWKCLDGSKEIPWNAVNNDYCDCEDGSDEPGTSACPNASFFCKNVGHFGMAIRSSRVNDGLCEPECCDGSDEAPGICPDKCEEIGKAYRAKVEAETKTRKTGSKIRSTYVAFASKEKKRLQDQLSTSEQEIAQREKEVTRLKDILDRVETTSAEALEKKKESPLYQSLITHSSALKSLKREYDKLKENERMLSDILAHLRSGYNPNYQDMAVLEAVRGYEHYAGLPPSNDRDKVEDEELGSDEELNTQSQEGEQTDEDIDEEEWPKERLEGWELGNVIGQDHETLLLEHEQHVGANPSRSILFDLSSYLPDTLVPQYEALRDTVVSLLETLGIAKGIESASADTSKARNAFQQAEQSLNLAKKEKEDAERELTRLFDAEWFGKQGEWKKLDGLCLEKDTGEYTYEVCLFDEARQKPNKGGSNFSLGKFRHWNNAPGVEVGSPEYYSKQFYKGGARCWNGPERSVTLLLSCGTENAILSVAEPEKCEYHLTGTTPALCLPLDASHASFPKAKEEL